MAGFSPASEWICFAWEKPGITKRLENPIIKMPCDGGWCGWEGLLHSTGGSVGKQTAAGGAEAKVRAEGGSHGDKKDEAAGTDPGFMGRRNQGGRVKCRENPLAPRVLASFFAFKKSVDLRNTHMVNKQIRQ